MRKQSKQSRILLTLPRDLKEHIIKEAKQARLPVATRVMQIVNEYILSKSQSDNLSKENDS